MKKILGVLAIVAMSFSANAGTTRLVNSTSQPVRINALHYHHLGGGPSVSFINTTGYTINPFTNWNPIIPNNAAIDLTGSGTSITQFTHYPVTWAIGIGGCGSVVITTDVAAPAGPVIVTCSSGTYTINWTISGPTNDVVITIS